MPKKRPPQEVWYELRRIVLKRDHNQCVRCGTEVSESTANIDHIKSGKHGTNALSNLRTLCRRCHVLRDDARHRGMIGSALRDGIIPPDWQPLLWSDDE